MPGEGPKKLWGGRFAGELDPVLHRFTTSLPFDRRLVRHDLVASLAHARMLLEVGVVEPPAAEAILGGLAGLLCRVEAGEAAVEGEDEDVHSWIERSLFAAIGEPAGCLHTARSRNDQTGAALRLFVREALERLLARAVELGRLWVEQAEAHLETWMPGYTHLQRGQPTSLAHHLLAHFWMLAADLERLRRAHRAAGVSPLGAGALAGTPHPIRPRRTADLLGFESCFANSMHAVADRDYVVEAAFACALVAVHLSRWAEEVVLWTSAELGFATLGDAVAKGSSLMPQKKNPEPAELIRGKTGRVLGDLQALLVMLKGLPLAYNSDLQEDKEAVFDALDTAEAVLAAAAALGRGLVYQAERLAAALSGGFVTATDLADYLVRRGVAFRRAHEQAGRAVREAEARGCELWQLPLPALVACCPEAGADVYASLAPESAVRARASEGGPAPERVREQLAAAHAELAAAEDWLGARRPPPIYAAYRAGRLAAKELP